MSSVMRLWGWGMSDKHELTNVLFWLTVIFAQWYPFSFFVYFIVFVVKSAYIL